MNGDCAGKYPPSQALRGESRPPPELAVRKNSGGMLGIASISPGFVGEAGITVTTRDGRQALVFSDARPAYV